MAAPIYEDDADASDEASSGPGGGVLDTLLNQTTTPEAQNVARGILKQWSSGAAKAGEQPILNEIETNADAAKEALRSAREKLLSMQISPEEQRYQRAAAWLAPTRTGRFGDTLESVAKEKAGEVEQQRDLEAAKSQLEGQEAQQEYGIDQNTLSAKLALQKLREQQWGPLTSEALRVLGRSIKPTSGNRQFKQIKTPDGKTQNVWVDPSGSTVTPEGEAFYPWPTPSDDTLKAMADYRIPGPTSAYAEAHPEAMDTLNKIIAIQPSYDASIQPAIARTRATWAAGAQKDKIGSLNMAISHLHFLDQAYDALNNTHDAVALNKIGNYLGLKLEGKAPQAAFQAIQSFVGGEVTRAVNQTSIGQERLDQESRINRDFSTPVGHATADTYRKLLTARLDAERGKWYSGMQLGVFEAGTPQYDNWKKTLDREFRSGLSPRTIGTLDPAPAESIADLQAHPEHAPLFKNHYGYLPGDVQ